MNKARPAAGNKDFAASLGRLVISWNWFEGQLRYFVGQMLGSGNASIVSAELGVSAYSSALSAFAKDVLKPDVGASLKHILDAAAILRAHRNYYVHGVIGTIGQRWEVDPPQQWSEGMIQYLSSKSSFQLIREQVHPDVCDEIALRIEETSEALANVLSVAMWDMSPSGERPPLHPKQPLPPGLAKVAHPARWLLQPHE